MSYFLEKFRNKAFWFVDSFQSSKVKEHFDEIKYLIENYKLKDARIIRENKLNEILEFSVNEVDFYKQYSGFNTIEDFPVVNKNIIRDNFQEFETLKFKNEKRFQVSTSGSTGVPFKTFFNSNKKRRNSADTIYFANKTGFEIGHKLLYIRFWGDQYKKNLIESWKQNVITHNVINLSDDDIKNLIEQIKNDKSTYGIVAYASALESICLYLDKINSGSIKTNIKSIILISEALNEYVLKSTQKYFGIKPLSRYSNSENGIIAQQMYDSKGFAINWASYYVEILKIDEDKLADFGELGRIVVTDLYNKAVPMIRYDTGDLGSMMVSEKYGIEINTIEGRIMDMLYDTSGNIISSHIVHQICVYEGVISYQLIQEDKKKYRFKLVVDSSFNKQNLIDKYKKYLGDDAEIVFEYVDEIPILNSGKKKKVLNLYKSK